MVCAILNIWGKKTYLIDNKLYLLSTKIFSMFLKLWLGPNTVTNHFIKSKIWINMLILKFNYCVVKLNYFDLL